MVPSINVLCAFLTGNSLSLSLYIPPFSIWVTHTQRNTHTDKHDKASDWLTDISMVNSLHDWQCLSKLRGMCVAWMHCRSDAKGHVICLCLPSPPNTHTHPSHHLFLPHLPLFLPHLKHVYPLAPHPFSSPSLPCCAKWKLLQRPGVAIVTCHSNRSPAPSCWRGLGVSSRPCSAAPQSGRGWGCAAG